VGRGRRLDHVGVRVRPPYARHEKWYADVLGFSLEVGVYAASDAEPAKNMRPWATRTAEGCDINLILNCATPPPAAGEGTEATLVTPEGALRPGILYAGFDVGVDAATALARVHAAGADAALDTDLPPAWHASLPPGANACLPGGPTVWVRDLCGSLIRLTPVSAA